MGALWCTVRTAASVRVTNSISHAAQDVAPSTKAAKVRDFIFSVAWWAENTSAPTLSGYELQFPLGPPILKMDALQLL